MSNLTDGRKDQHLSTGGVTGSIHSEPWTGETLSRLPLCSLVGLCYKNLHSTVRLGIAIETVLSLVMQHFIIPLILSLGPQPYSIYSLALTEKCADLCLGQMPHDSP